MYQFLVHWYKTNGKKKKRTHKQSNVVYDVQCQEACKELNSSSRKQAYSSTAHLQLKERGRSLRTVKYVYWPVSRKPFTSLVKPSLNIGGGQKTLLITHVQCRPPLFSSNKRSHRFTGPGDSFLHVTQQAKGKHPN